MAEKLKIISLGGLNEIGKNITVLEYGKDIIIVDCGLGFPEDDMYGVDLVIADMTYLVKNKQKIRGLFLTHGHEDMSMYGVNAGVPKTLVRYLVQYEAETAATAALHDVLLDILATPVSPELLPAKDGEIAQITEDLVGPYELHDFYLYYVLRCGFGPAKIYRLAKAAFAGRAEYTDAVLYKWLRNFYWRFFAQQFKRSCLPDGPKVGSVTLSPRGDWRMPSDACATLWLAELEQLKPGEQ